ncbi:glycerol-3-phosphate phosphatase isoform X3 [Phocoena sinus]|uniref:glycerol-3-phosphate phosphatase isoform X3 n=1 Tax=Phocoena sinus TaxID=42100 RepID=UPI0013C409D9|nr:glycerol-3-phosphate phosphatase isoform X3 [Phocoena sinus]
MGIIIVIIIMASRAGLRMKKADAWKVLDTLSSTVASLFCKGKWRLREVCGYLPRIKQLESGRSGTEMAAAFQHWALLPPPGCWKDPRPRPPGASSHTPARAPVAHQVKWEGARRRAGPCRDWEAEGGRAAGLRAGQAVEAIAEVYTDSPGGLDTGTGCLVRAVEMAAQRQADVIGKPSRFIFDCVSQEYGINPERTIMVGDRLDTDILLGVTCGLKTILTLTGVSTLRDVKSNQESDCLSKKKMVPDFYVDSIADLLPALQG